MWAINDEPCNGGLFVLNRQKNWKLQDLNLRPLHSQCDALAGLS